MGEPRRVVSALRYTPEEHFAAPAAKKVVVPLTLTEQELTDAFIEFVGKRAAAQFGALLDTHAQQSVSVKWMKSELRKRTRELGLVRSEAEAFREATKLSDATEKALSHWVKAGYLGNLSEWVIQATLGALESSGYEVVGVKDPRVRLPKASM